MQNISIKKRSNKLLKRYGYRALPIQVSAASVERVMGLMHTTGYLAERYYLMGDPQGGYAVTDGRVGGYIGPTEDTPLEAADHILRYGLKQAGLL